MILSVKGQVLIFFLSILLGGLLGILYDFIRIFRRLVKHINFWVQIEDIFYWISSSIFVFLVLLYKNNGEVRIFFILGIFIGALLYFLTVSDFFIKIFLSIFKFLRKLILLFLKLVYIPLKTLVKTIFCFLRPILKRLISIIKKLKLILKKSQIYVKIKNNYNLKNKFKQKEDKSYEVEN